MKEQFLNNETKELVADNLDDAIEFARKQEPHIEYRVEIENIEVSTFLTSAFLRYTPKPDIISYLARTVKHQAEKHGIVLEEVTQ